MSNDFTKIGVILAEISAKVNECITLLSKDNTPEAVKPEPSVKKVFSLEEVRKVLAEKSRDGFTAEVKELLKKHNASRLSEVKEDEYGALVEEAGSIGNGK